MYIYMHGTHEKLAPSLYSMVNSILHWALLKSLFKRPKPFVSFSSSRLCQHYCDQRPVRLFASSSIVVPKFRSVGDYILYGRRNNHKCPASKIKYEDKNYDFRLIDCESDGISIANMILLPIRLECIYI